MRRIKFLFITFLIFVVCFGCSGCSMSCNHNLQKEYLIEEMNKLEIEVEGYKLISYEEWEHKQTSDFVKYEGFLGNGKRYPVEGIVNGKCITLTHNTINYDNITIEITKEFMASKSEIFRKAHAIWGGYSFIKNNQPNYVSKEIHTTIFDNRVFIKTYGMKEEFIKTYKDEVPAMLYMYDLESEQILYCGYYFSGIENGDIAVIKSED